MSREPNRGIRMPSFKARVFETRPTNIHSGTLAAIDYIAEVYLRANTQTQPCGDVEQMLREAIGYEPTE